MLLVQLLFQSAACPSLPFSSPPPPPVLSFLILCLVLVGLCSWGKALFPSGWVVPLGKGWARRSCWLQQVASCLGRGPGCLTCSVGSRKGSSHVASASPPPPSLQWGGWRPQQKMVGTYLPRMLWLAWNPVHPGHLVRATKGGFSVVTQWC